MDINTLKTLVAQAQQHLLPEEHEIFRKQVLRVYLTNEKNCALASTRKSICTGPNTYVAKEDYIKKLDTQLAAL